MEHIMVCQDIFLVLHLSFCVFGLKEYWDLQDFVFFWQIDIAIVYHED